MKQTAFTDKELTAIKFMVQYLGRHGCHGEDVIGAIMYTGAFRLLEDSDKAVVALARKLGSREPDIELPPIRLRKKARGKRGRR